MLQIDHLLCLMSGGFPPSTGFRHAVHLAAMTGANLHVFPVSTNPQASDRDTLREQIQSLRPSDSVEVRVGPSVDSATDPISVLQQYLATKGISLVVTDPPSRREPTPPLTDSFLRRLTLEITPSIFIAGQGTRSASTRRILVPTDFSDHSFRALVHATGLAHHYDASILLLHVVEESPYVALTSSDQLSLSESTLADHRAHRRLRKFMRQGRGGDASIEPHLAFGTPETEIAHFVQKHDVDLVVLSSHGTATRPDKPLGHVVEGVLRRVSTSVFLVRAFGRAPVERGGV